MFEQYIANELNQYYDTIQNSKLKDIIIYSLEGGKCIRGFIIKHIIETLTGNTSPWQPIASIELIHGISLILDDLPCMDNDMVRRGKPSTFARVGERHSILVSMYGISEAFKILFSGLKNVNNNCVSGDSKTVFESTRTKRAPEHSETVRPFLNGGSHNFIIRSIFNYCYHPHMYHYVFYMVKEQI